MILIGTNHDDLEGPRRLGNALNVMKPKKISVECPSNYEISDVILYYERFRESAPIWVKNSVSSKKTQKYLNEIISNRGFEIFTTLEYAKKNNSEVFFVDNELSYRALTEMDQIFVIEEMREHERQIKEITAGAFGIFMKYADIRKKIVADNDRHYNTKFLNTDHITENNVNKRFDSRMKEADEREENMAKNIMERMPDVHIGGLWHMFYTPETSPIPLHLRLGNIPLERRTLKEFD